MEYPHREKLIQRGLAVLFACALAAAGAQQKGSSLSQAVTDGRPWLAWLSVAGPGQKDLLYLAVYEPRQRILGLSFIPSASRPEPDLLSFFPETVAAAPAFIRLKSLGLKPGQEPAAWIKDWILKNHWPVLMAAEGLPRFEKILLALELARLRPARLHASWLPEDSEQRSLLWRFLLKETAPPRDEAALLTAEILNASGKSGLASQAKKVLRLQGIDVVATGNSDSPGETTLVYDRTGRHENAETVRRLLDCPSAKAVTRMDPKRLVDVSVLLRDDCPLR